MSLQTSEKLYKLFIPNNCCFYIMPNFVTSTRLRFKKVIGKLSLIVGLVFKIKYLVNFLQEVVRK